jgi:Putative Flp pilus-assembly TadE/G-like
MLLALTILGTMVFVVGLAMSDRRNLQAYADAAALVGARSYSQGVSRAHRMAMQYLGASLNFALQTGSCASTASCAAGRYSVAGYEVIVRDSYRVGGILNYPTVLDVALSHRQPSSSCAWSVTRRLRPPRPLAPRLRGPHIAGVACAVAAVTSDAMTTLGGAAFQTVTGPVYVYGSFGATTDLIRRGSPRCRPTTTAPWGTQSPSSSRLNPEHARAQRKDRLDLRPS